jgi:hypothetical protein
MTALDLTASDLPRVFTPAEAAEILRQLGLAEMTECALRTRAYRRQVPFHLNGRRIRFTANDLREIAEGGARQPKPSIAVKTGSAPRRSAPRRSSVTPIEQTGGTWRARRSRDTLASRRERQPG